jgi:hypothetical protein
MLSKMDRFARSNRDLDGWYLLIRDDLVVDLYHTSVIGT